MINRLMSGSASLKAFQKWQRTTPSPFRCWADNLLNYKPEYLQDHSIGFGTEKPSPITGSENWNWRSLFHFVR